MDGSIPPVIGGGCHGGRERLTEAARAAGKSVAMEIYDWTDGNPYFIKSVCRRLFKIIDSLHERSPASPGDLNRAVKLTLGDGETLFRHFCENRDEAQWAILRFLAHHTELGRWATVASAERYVNDSIPSHVAWDDAIERLNRLGIVDVDRSQGGVRMRIAIKLFHEWLRLFK